MYNSNILNKFKTKKILIEKLQTNRKMQFQWTATITVWHSDIKESCATLINCITNIKGKTGSAKTLHIPFQMCLGNTVIFL